MLSSMISTDTSVAIDQYYSRISSCLLSPVSRLPASPPPRLLDS